jgi:predicted ATPase
MVVDRITGVRIRGMRTLADVSLKLDKLTVLIGENGAGKSSIVEAIEILRKAGEAGSILGRIAGSHQGLFSLMRHGATELSFDATIQGDALHAEYGFAIAAVGSEVRIVRERLTVEGREGALISGDGNKWAVSTDDDKPIPDVVFEPGQLLLTAFGITPPDSRIRRVALALANIEVHLPFEVRAAWALRERNQTAPLREPTMLQLEHRLSRSGTNLANCFHALRSEFGDAHWHGTMDLVRLGLGAGVRSVNARPGPGGGSVALSIEVENSSAQIPAVAIADGALAYLAFVALVRLPAPARSLLVFDEPDLHLHPALLTRVLGFFEKMADQHPVLLTTHSDRLLDGLSDPGGSAVLCRLKVSSVGTEAELVRPDPDGLAKWLERYKGLGDLRAEGMEDVIMRSIDEPV